MKSLFNEMPVKIYISLFTYSYFTYLANVSMQISLNMTGTMAGSSCLLNMLTCLRKSHCVHLILLVGISLCNCGC